MTTTVTLSSGANVVLDGRFRITNITLVAAAATVVDFYDDDDATLTQSEGEYTQRAVTTGYSRSRNGIADCAGYSNDYTYAGISTANETVAADGTEALPKKLSYALGAAGSVGADIDLNMITYQGLVANMTTGSSATLIVTYQAV